MSTSRIQLYPLLRVAIALMAGILTADALCDAVAPQVWLYALCAATAAATVMHTARRSPTLHTAVLLLAVALCGCLRQSVSLHSFDLRFDGKVRHLTAVVVSPPATRSRTIRYELMPTDGPLAGRRIYAYFAKGTRHLAIGDAIETAARLENPYTGNAATRRRLQAHDIVARTYIADGRWHTTQTSLARLSAYQRMQLRMGQYRQRLANILRRRLAAGDAMAITAAMTLGDRQALSADIRNTYSMSGVSHILALSGMHLGIIYFVLSAILARSRRRSAMQAAVLAAVWGYAALSGMSPSIVRSAVMYTLFGIGTMFFRRTMSPNTLSAAAILILAFSPASLWDISFQMSFAAVAGILLFQPGLYGLAGRRIATLCPPIGWCWSMATVSVAAQIATAPLAAYYFGRFPCYFLLSNFIAIPLATLLIYAAMAMLAMPFAPALQDMLATVIQHIVHAMNSSLAWVASLPGASIGSISINAGQLATIYIVIALAAMLARYATRMYSSAHSCHTDSPDGTQTA